MPYLLLGQTHFSWAVSPPCSCLQEANLHRLPLCSGAIKSRETMEGRQYYTVHTDVRILCMHTWTSSHRHTWLTCTYVRMYVCMWMCSTYKSTHSENHTQTHANTHTHTHTRTHTHMRVWAHTRYTMASLLLESYPSDDVIQATCSPRIVTRVTSCGSLQSPEGRQQQQQKYVALCHQ